MEEPLVGLLPQNLDGLQKLVAHGDADYFSRTEPLAVQCAVGERTNESLLRMSLAALSSSPRQSSELAGFAKSTCYFFGGRPKAVGNWITTGGARTAHITPGSLWENGYIENFNSKLRDEFLNGEIFYTLAEAKVFIEGWRRPYNKLRRHSSRGHRPPAPEVRLWQAKPPSSGTPPVTPTLAPRPHLN